MSGVRIDRSVVASVVTIILVVLAQSVFGAEIHEMAEEGNLEGVKRAITANPELINARDEEDQTPLFAACIGGHLELAKYLIAHGADVNAKDRYLSTPMHLLAYRDLTEPMKVLLANKGQVNVQNHSKATPLHLAALADGKAAVALLIAFGADLNIKDSYERTPLILCARERGGPQTIKTLLDAGADVNVKDKFDDDALELAAWRGKKEVVDLLLDAGARVPSDETDSREMFGYATENGLARLFFAVVKAGGDPNYPLPTGGTLAHSAAAGGSVEILQGLAGGGSDINAQDVYGWTPLHYAARDGRVECLQWLCEKTKNINARNLAGQSPFNIAQDRKMTAAAAVLRTAKADTGPSQFPTLKGPYLGQKPPDQEPQRFATGIVSSIWNLHSSISFSPEGDLAFWASSEKFPGEVYTKTDLTMMRKRQGRWAQPGRSPFTGSDRGDVPFFAPDGSRVYFLSRRTMPDEPDSRAERIWYTNRDGDSWGPARLVDSVVNDYPQHWQISVDEKRTIYFSSNLPEGQGMADIYRSDFEKGKWQKPVNLGTPVNSENREETPYIAPDGSYLIMNREGDLFISYRTDNAQWSQPQDIGRSINSTSAERCPIVSPDGKYLFFISNREGTSHIFWVSADFIERLRPSTKVDPPGS